MAAYSSPASRCNLRPVGVVCARPRRDRPTPLLLALGCMSWVRAQGAETLPAGICASSPPHVSVDGAAQLLGVSLRSKMMAARYTAHRRGWAYPPLCTHKCGARRLSARDGNLAAPPRAPRPPARTPCRGAMYVQVPIDPSRLPAFSSPRCRLSHAWRGPRCPPMVLALPVRAGDAKVSVLARTLWIVPTHI